MHRAVALTVALCFLAVIVLASVVTATVTTSTIQDRQIQAGVTSPGANATETADTSVATDRSISGFTVGAAVIAVLVGGSLWYFRH